MRMTEAKATAGCFFLASTKVVVHDSWKLQYVQRLHRKEDPWLLNSTSSSSRKVMSVPRNSYTCTCACMHAKSLQSCLTLGDPMNCSLPGSFVHGISQARLLEWVAISLFVGSCIIPGSVSLLVIGLFIFSISSWVNLGRFFIARNFLVFVSKPYAYFVSI